MYETIVFCSPRSGSSVFNRWLTDLGYVDFKEIYSSIYDFNIISIPTKKEAKTAEYIPLVDKNLSFEERNKKLLQSFLALREPEKIVYKIFLNWHYDFSKEQYYLNYIKSKHKILLLRKDFVEWTSSMLLQLDGIYLGKLHDPEPVELKLDRRFFSNTIRDFYKFIDTVDKLNTIVIYEDAIRDKTVDDNLQNHFGIKQNFNSHIKEIDNPLDKKEKYIKNFKEFKEFVKPYETEYNSILNKIKEKYVTNSDTHLIGVL